MGFEERFTHFKEIIDNSRHIVFFGGAGVSTESGIPDFRSKDGLYNQHDVRFDNYQPEYLLSHDCLFNEPKVFYEYYRQKLDCRGIEPNITHKKLAELEKKGKRVSIITQNIDGLHQKAGSREVYEIHGTTLRNYCSRCKKKFDSDYIFNSKSLIVNCPDCKEKGLVRPDVTLYGEQLPQDFIKATEIIGRADVLIVAGTSLTVYPAASLIQYFNGDKLIVINRDNTSADNIADIVFRENMGEVFGRL